MTALKNNAFAFDTVWLWHSHLRLTSVFDGVSCCEFNEIAEACIKLPHWRLKKAITGLLKRSCRFGQMHTHTQDREKETRRETQTSGLDAMIDFLCLGQCYNGRMFRFSTIKQLINIFECFASLGEEKKWRTRNLFRNKRAAMRKFWWINRQPMLSNHSFRFSYDFRTLATHVKVISLPNM